jgi:hypothetical protein
MKRLYIIGNGFDRYHHLETGYDSFALFLYKNYHDLYDNLIENYGLDEIDENDPKNLKDIRWAHFEQTLAELNFEDILENNRDLEANPYSPDFRDSDWNTFQVEMEMLVEKLTKELFSAFKDFILNVKFPAIIQSEKLHLNLNSSYLTFNYTDTLEQYYNILQDRILYIHKKAKEPNDTLVLGHGVNPANFNLEEPEPPTGLSIEELENWEQQNADRYNVSFESAKEEILTYFSKSFKKTATIISDNKIFFDNINHFDEVIVLGHSLADVDLPYFIKVIDAIRSKKTRWFVSFRGLERDCSHKQTLISLGLRSSQITLIRIEYLRNDLWHRTIFCLIQVI